MCRLAGIFAEEVVAQKICLLLLDLYLTNRMVRAWALVAPSVDFACCIVSYLFATLRMACPVVAARKYHMSLSSSLGS